MRRAPKRCTAPNCGNDQPCPDHTRRPWATSTRRATLPADWQRRRLAVFRRDNWRCIDCGHHDPTGRTLECDHTGDRHDHRTQSLATRCGPCHRQRTLAQAARARGARTP